jgi:hypothetical protein
VLQNRESQRRSRARHREQVDQMRSQLLAYGRSEVTASVEMQQAARQVAKENRRLRILLSRHGVSTEEIDSFLSLPDEEVEEGVAVTFGSRIAKNQLLKMKILPVVASKQDSRTPTLSPRPNIAAHQPNYNYSTASISTLERVKDTKSVGPSGEADCNPRPDARLNTSTSTSMPETLQTDCNTAATIIASVQGHGDAARALVALGCPDRGECFVKNTDLFHLMDSAT